jgi:threonine synthase
VFWKNEGANPTLSHKDRFQSVAVSVARALGYTGIVGTSTGNHGIAGAAYATVGGLKSLMFYPPEMSTAFLHLTSLYGGRAAVTAWERRPAALARVRERAGWCPVDGSNPFGLEGYKTIAYEVVRDLGHAPSMVLIPVGSGKLFTGISRGFRDLVGLGLIDHLPRLIACQAQGVDVLTQPFEEGQTSVPRREDISTVALSTKEPTADARVLEALRDSHGSVVTVEEGAIMDAVRALGREGLAVEPASALGAAAIQSLLERGQVDVDAEAVCVLTASLLKTPELLPEAASARPWRLGIDTTELDRYMDEWEHSDE